MGDLSLHPTDQANVKKFISTWNKELYSLVLNRPLDGKYRVLQTETINGKKYTFSLAFKYEAAGSSWTDMSVKAEKKPGPHLYTIHLPLTLVGAKEVATLLLHELAIVKLSMARTAPTIAAKSSLYQGYSEVLNSAKKAPEKSIIESRLAFIVSKTGASQKIAKDKASQLFETLILEKYVSDFEAETTGIKVSNDKLAEKYSSAYAAQAGGDPTGNFHSEAASALLEVIEENVLSLYEKLTLPENYKTNPENVPASPPAKSPPLPEHGKKTFFNKLKQFFASGPPDSDLKKSSVYGRSRPFAQDLLQRQQNEQAELKRRQEQMKREQSERLIRGTRERMDRIRGQGEQSREQRGRTERERQERARREQQERERQQREQSERAERQRQERERRERTERLRQERERQMIRARPKVQSHKPPPPIWKPKLHIRGSLFPKIQTWKATEGVITGRARSHLKR